ncbi:hypothetical protein [Persicitalea jodogahamensis]|uniref:Uncharacterized protein n=1 Tax=Persicitalea jodogahamensis TaxID=402147 RepID=A0A8J3D6X0_9BACT|nr:hypothetical protein [Persicitalea jodogahamensis]GHB54383.1 hypothetical protein GCM10007390_04210 [Persicitalea jodogahamensis]
MYTAYIGKRLIQLVNQREGKERSAQEFFDEVYIPLFFMNERYLQHVNNSKFDQAYKQKKKTPLTTEVLANALSGQHEKILTDAPDGSFFLGGAAAEASAGTSGQVTDLVLPITEHEVYASWVGAAMGVGVSGGLNVLIDSNEVLLALYEGWYRYREYLTQTPNLKPHQVNTWNGYWLTNVFDARFDPEYPFANKSPDIKTDAKTGTASIETTSWVKVIFALSERMPNQSLNTYVYSLSQMNTTVGFVAMELPAVRYLNELYQKISRESGALTTDSFDTLYDTALGFQRACELGKIGIPALEPKQLREHMPGRGTNKPFKQPKDKDDPILITYNLYQTWIIAMLNNQQLIDLTTKVASVLNEFANEGDRGKKVNSNAVDKLLETKNRREFIEKMAEFVKNDEKNATNFDELGNTIILMPTTDFPLFMALLKLKYAVAKTK